MESPKALFVGPLLLLIYVHDLHASITLRFYLFSDDAKLDGSSKDIATLLENLQQTFIRIDNLV